MLLSCICFALYGVGAISISWEWQGGDGTKKLEKHWFEQWIEFEHFIAGVKNRKIVPKFYAGAEDCLQSDVQHDSYARRLCMFLLQQTPHFSKELRCTRLHFFVKAKKKLMQGGWRPWPCFRWAIDNRSCKKFRDSFDSKRFDIGLQVHLWSNAAAVVMLVA